MSSSQNVFEVPDGRLIIRRLRESRIAIGSTQIAPSPPSLLSPPQTISLVRSLLLHLCCPRHRHAYRISSLSIPTSGVTLLPPALDSQRKTLLLDLDETLVHVTQDPAEKYTFSLLIDIQGQPTTFYISTRPYLDQFLTEIARFFEVVLFTAAEKVYADPITDAIDTKGLITHRLYREHCVNWHGRLVKDLSCLGRSLRKVVLIDVKTMQDSEENFKFQPTNGVKIKRFQGDPEDSALLDLEPLLDRLKGTADVRGVLEKRLKAVVRSPTY